MPIATSTTTSGRLLSLLSLLQVRRDWPGLLLAERLGVSERTVRRDVDRLRELGYLVHAVKGPDGGYRLEAGSQVPPLLFDEDQAVALAVALKIAVGTGAGIEEAAARALATVRQVLPSRLRQRVDTLEISAAGGGTQVDTDVLLALSSAVRACEEVRFDYASPGRPESVGPPRRVQPHHLVVRGGRWYLVGWSAEREDWRTYRADRMTLRVPNGPRFRPREVPGADVAAFLAARFKGSETTEWPCRGEVVLGLPLAEVAPFVGGDTASEAGDGRTRLLAGAWSWAALAANLLRFDCEVEVVGPQELRDAFGALSERAVRAARPGVG
ncbi:helix-turn-helix transcriptional regulator [Lentzea albida]|uniref:Predicted DNA-binding transcriptional regulator YafY, contains an HTH and WYL domains n=1 Tax=Lentzea albida TaxID=65499 RepID=A0A1H9XFB3_9PSEU|nr:WYL domain-containing protein [Lentzea albida]SES44729.1 Predicted DNA-binding transcriptional regulator YafY, contains an HTH and WYL domains [Lentzea albida]